jgi:hypothetical protein
MKTNKVLSIGLVIVAVTLGGCAPPKVLDPVSIKPNETVWVIPLDSDAQAQQTKFNSIDYLNQKKVAAKRIMIDKVKRNIGYSWQWWAIEWIPSVRVITVDRSLVTREWTDSTDTGTTTANQGIPVNTKDNIGLTIGLTVTVSIDEDDASTYLYYHGERTLADVCDQNIRSYAVAELNRQVSSMNLVDFQQNQAQIYAQLFKDAAATFKDKGITIQYLGNAEGWHFKDPTIQASINKSFIAQQDNKTAEMEQNAQKTRNATMILNNNNDNQIKIATAQAQADAANKLESVKDAVAFQNQVQVSLLEAQAKMAMATKWNGSMPANILPDNSPILLNLGTDK